MLLEAGDELQEAHSVYRIPSEITVVGGLKEIGSFKTEQRDQWRGKV